MTQVTGTLQNIKGRETKFGTFFDLIVDGKTYGVGKFAPRGVQEGDIVTFEYETKQNGQYTNYNVKPRTLRKVDGADSGSTPATGAAPAGASAVSAAPARTKYEAFDERQEIISKQAALNTALAFGNLAVEAGAILVPKSAKDSDKLALVQNWVLTEASRFYNMTTGRTWDVQLSDTVETPKEVAAAAKAGGRKAASAPAPASDDTGSDEWQDDEIPF